MAPADAGTLIQQAVWMGVVPATLALGLGAVLRRLGSRNGQTWGTHPFVYILGRGFLGTVVCVFIAALLAQSNGITLPNVAEGLTSLGHWLMAWGDGVVTGMCVAIFVAFKPQWLATWSDRLYLTPPPSQN